MAVGGGSAPAQQQQQWQELREADKTEAEGAPRPCVNVPADGDVEHLRGKGAEPPHQQEQDDVAPGGK